MGLTKTLNEYFSEKFFFKYNFKYCIKREEFVSNFLKVFKQKKEEVFKVFNYTEQTNFLLKDENFHLYLENEFLNLQLSYNFLNKQNREIEVLKLNKDMLIEHTSANPIGVLHTGNLLNTLLGRYLKNFYTIKGYNVYSLFYVNDRGMAICKFIYNLISNEDLFFSDENIQNLHNYITKEKILKTDARLEETDFVKEKLKVINNLINNGILCKLVKKITSNWLSKIKFQVKKFKVKFDFFQFESKLSSNKIKDIFYICCILSEIGYLFNDKFISFLKENNINLKYSSKNLSKFTFIFSSNIEFPLISINTQFGNLFLTKDKGVCTYFLHDLLLLFNKHFFNNITIFGIDHKQHALVLQDIQKKLDNSNLIKKFKFSSLFKKLYNNNAEKQNPTKKIVFLPLLKEKKMKISKRKGNDSLGWKTLLDINMQLNIFLNFDQNVEEINLENIKNINFIKIKEDFSNFLIKTESSEIDILTNYLEPELYINENPSTFLKSFIKLHSSLENIKVNSVNKIIISNVLSYFMSLYLK